MTGISMARSTRSGTGLGPGMFRKWRPWCWVMASSSAWLFSRSPILHSIYRAATLKLCTILVDGLIPATYVRSHETNASQRDPFAGPQLGAAEGRTVAARRNPLPPARPHRRGQHSRGRPGSGAAVVRDAEDLAHPAARGAQGAGGRRAGGAFAQSRRAGAGFKRTGPW